MTGYLPYLIPLILAAGLSVIFTYFWKNYCIKRGWVKPARDLDIHPTPLPRMGGVSFGAAFLIISLIYFLIFHHHFFSQGTTTLKFLAVAAGGLIILGMGFWDDLKGIDPFAKLFWQILAAGIVVAAGISIDFIRIPYFGVWNFTGWWEVIFSMFWIVLIANVVNFLDGLDGLATGVGAIAGIILFFLSLYPFVHQPATALLSIIFAGVLLGFLPFNFYPAKIFMGDSGSHFIGYLIAVLAIISGGKVATAFLTLGVAIFDAFFVVASRLWLKKSLVAADKRHLHQRLLALNFTPRQVVIFFWVVSGLLGTVALLSDTANKIQAMYGLIGAMIILIILILYGEKKNWRRA